MAWQPIKGASTEGASMVEQVLCRVVAERGRRGVLVVSWGTRVGAQLREGKGSLVTGLGRHAGQLRDCMELAAGV